MPGIKGKHASELMTLMVSLTGIGIILYCQALCGNCGRKLTLVGRAIKDSTVKHLDVAVNEVLGASVFSSIK